MLTRRNFLQSIFATIAMFFAGVLRVEGKEDKSIDRIDGLLIPPIDWRMEGLPQICAIAREKMIEEPPFRGGYVDRQGNVHWDEG
jgi:hypothetical protein